LGGRAFFLFWSSRGRKRAGACLIDFLQVLSPFHTRHIRLLQGFLVQCRTGLINSVTWQNIAIWRGKGYWYQIYCLRRCERQVYIYCRTLSGCALYHCIGHTQITLLRLPGPFVCPCTEPGPSGHKSKSSTMKRYSYTPGSKQTVTFHIPFSLLVFTWLSGWELSSQPLKVPARCTLFASGALNLNVMGLFFIGQLICLKQVTFITIQQTSCRVCRRTNNYFVMLSVKKPVIFIATRISDFLMLINVSQRLS
jgi:hypothetical protein